METAHIRRQNLQSLVSEKGTQEILADLLGVSPGYISQLTLGTRPITEKTARKYERALGLEAQWFDRPHNPVDDRGDHGAPPEYRVLEDRGQFMTDAGLPQKHRIEIIGLLQILIRLEPKHLRILHTIALAFLNSAKKGDHHGTENL